MRIDPATELTKAQRAVFRRLSAIVRDSGLADTIYDRLPGARAGKIISVDVARFLAPEFTTREGRIVHTPSTANPSGAYAHDRLFRLLASKPSEGSRRPPRLLVMAGGAGSGKTSYLTGRAVDDVDLVFDNQLLSPRRASKLLDQAIRMGWETTIRYVHRPFELVVPAVIERSERTGRWNKFSELPSMHMRAQGSIERILERYAGRAGVYVLAVENAGTSADPRPPVEIPIESVVPGGSRRYTSVSELRKIVHEEVGKAIREGRISQAVLDAGAGG